jgi:hypothetical protein
LDVIGLVIPLLSESRIGRPSRKQARCRLIQIR